VAGVRNGDRLALARALTQVENEIADAVTILRALFPVTGQAHIIGVTGAPGTGKSTLVTALVKQYRAADFTVAVVAIDPTSPFTGGALLGDRVRMRALSGDAGVFVRSMATRGSLGGLSKTTDDAVTLLDAAGFDRIIVETVGVGQAEVAIASTAHTTVVVEAPGMGDEVQAIKAGVLEIADILVVNKADRSGAERTVRALQMALSADGGATRQMRHHGRVLAVELPADAVSNADEEWAVQVLKTNSTSGEGVEAVRQRVEAHRDWLLDSGVMQQRERLRIAHTLENIVRAELNRRLQVTISPAELDQQVDAVLRRERDPFQAVKQLLAQL